MVPTVAQIEAKATKPTRATEASFDCASQAATNAMLLQGILRRRAVEQRWLSHSVRRRPCSPSPSREAVIRLGPVSVDPRADIDTASTQASHWTQPFNAEGLGLGRIASLGILGHVKSWRFQHKGFGAVLIQRWFSNRAPSLRRGRSAPGRPTTGA